MGENAEEQNLIEELDALALNESYLEEQKRTIKVEPEKKKPLPTTTTTVANPEPIAAPNPPFIQPPPTPPVVTQSYSKPKVPLNIEEFIEDMAEKEKQKIIKNAYDKLWRTLTEPETKPISTPQLQQQSYQTPQVQKPIIESVAQPQSPVSPQVVKEKKSYTIATVIKATLLSGISGVAIIVILSYLL